MNINITFLKITVPAVLAFMASCTGKTIEITDTLDEEVEIYPDYKDVMIPCNIAPMNFKVVGNDGKSYALLADGEALVESADGNFSIPIKAWRELVSRHLDGAIEFTVARNDNGKWVGYRPFSMQVSRDEIDSHLAYRLIEPGYQSWNVLGIYQRNLTNFDESAIVTNQGDKRNCVNCHEFENRNASRGLFHMRGENGATYFFENGKVERVALEKLGPKKNASTPAWNPDGRFIAFSSSTSRQIFYSEGEKAIEVYNNRGDMLIYDTKEKKMLSYPCFSDENLWTDYEAWSATGDTLYFCMAIKRNVPMEYRKIRYSLCRIPFDHKTGNVGAKIDTIVDAERAGCSTVLPSLSPNGKFLLYAVSDYGMFPLWHRESRLEMRRLDTDSVIDTSALNLDMPKSYTSWSSNSHWIAFSARPDFRHTRVYFAHVDDNGKQSKPFLLPQLNADYNTLRLKSYNIPKFVKGECAPINL